MRTLYALLVHSHAPPSTIALRSCWCVSNTFLVMVCNVAGGGGGCMRVVEGARDGGGTGGEYGRCRWWCGNPWAYSHGTGGPKNTRGLPVTRDEH